MRPLTLIGILTAVAVVLLATVTVFALQPGNHASFSTATTHTIFNGGIQRLYDGNIYETPLDLLGNPLPVHLAIEDFPPRALGIDALQDLQPIRPGVVFSTQRSGLVAGDYLFHSRAYYYNTDTAEVSLYAPLANLSLGSLDALAALPEGFIDNSSCIELPDEFPGVPRMWAFSTGNLEVVVQHGNPLPLHPGNVYCYDRLEDRIVLLVDTGAKGVGNVDALDVPRLNFTYGGYPFRGPDYPSYGPMIAFSTDRTELVLSDWGLTRLDQNDMYLIEPGSNSTLNTVEYFDGNLRRLRDLDAYSEGLGNELIIIQP